MNNLDSFMIYQLRENSVFYWKRNSYVEHPIGDNINLERSYIKHTLTYAKRVWHMEWRVKLSNWRKYAYLKFLNMEDNIQLKVDWTLHESNHNN